MAPAKQPESPSYHYHPLPPNHQQPHPTNNQYYVVLPFYLPDAIRRRWRSRIICAASLLLLAIAVFFFWPSDPALKIVRARLDRFQVRTKPSISLDIALGLTVKVRNSDLYSMDYQSVKVSIGYRGKQLGFVTSDHGHVKARGSSYVNATLDLNGIEILSDVFFLIEDLARGSVPLDTISEIRGTLGFFFFQFPLKAKISCEIYVNPRNHTIMHQNCSPE